MELVSQAGTIWGRRHKKADPGAQPNSQPWKVGHIYNNPKTLVGNWYEHRFKVKHDQQPTHKKYTLSRPYDTLPIIDDDGRVVRDQHISKEAAEKKEELRQLLLRAPVQGVSAVVDGNTLVDNGQQGVKSKPSCPESLICDTPQNYGYAQEKKRDWELQTRADLFEEYQRNTIYRLSYGIAPSCRCPKPKVSQVETTKETKLPIIVGPKRTIPTVGHNNIYTPYQTTGQLQQKMVQRTAHRYWNPQSK